MRVTTAASAAKTGLRLSTACAAPSLDVKQYWIMSKHLRLKFRGNKYDRKERPSLLATKESGRV